MARTELTVQRVSPDGLVATYDAAIADGHSFEWGERHFLHVKNGDTSSTDITIQTPQTIGGLDVSDKVVTVAAGDEEFIGPFLGRETYEQSDGQVYFDYSNTTSITVAVLQI